MNLRTLTDQNLLLATKTLVKKEREVLIDVLHHLREVERRRLYCDFGFKSLFEYAVQELKYSEGQAGRRLQAMRLIKEIPEVEQKIQSGALSLSNISQAQSFFRESKKREPQKTISPKEKLNVLAKLENKSAREGQKVLLQRQPEAALPKDRERQVTESHTEVRFIMSQELRSKLDQLRSLLGPSAAMMSFAELVERMTEIAIDSQMQKRFGKKRVSKVQGNKKGTANKPLKEESAVNEAPSEEQYSKTLKAQNRVMAAPEHAGKNLLPKANIQSEASFEGEANSHVKSSTAIQVATSESPNSLNAHRKVVSKDRIAARTPTSDYDSKYARHISRSIKYQVWCRDGGRCTNCGSYNNINFDHIRPVALGGGAEPDNLRLLCFNCNQRQAIKSFGLASVERNWG